MRRQVLIEEDPAPPGVAFRRQDGTAAQRLGEQVAVWRDSPDPRRKSSATASMPTSSRRSATSARDVAFSR